MLTPLCSAPFPVLGDSVDLSSPGSVQALGVSAAAREQLQKQQEVGVMQEIGH